VTLRVPPYSLLLYMNSLRIRCQLYLYNIKVFIEELTDGERKVLELVASGVRRREIAEQLFISERTVSNHLQHIFEKLQVSSTVEMITKAIKLGYIAQSSIQRSCERKASCASGSDRS